MTLEEFRELVKKLYPNEDEIQILIEKQYESALKSMLEKIENDLYGVECHDRNS